MAVNVARGDRRRGGKIAARVRNINLILIVLALALIISTASFMITDVTSKASKDLAFFYSLEAVNVFNSYISRDLALVQKVANSKAVTEWFADEQNESKRYTAFNEMMDYLSLLNSTELYFVIDGSLNEFSVTVDSFEDFKPFDVLDQNDEYDHWYFDLVNSDRTYAFNIDEDKVTNQWRIWINHKVMYNGKIVGVFCSGIRLETVLRSMFERYEVDNVTGYVIDKHGYIQLDSTLSEFNENAEVLHIHEVSNDPVFNAYIDTYLAGINGYFGALEQPEVIPLSKGRYASVAPLPHSDWMVVTFYDSNALFSTATLVPLVIVLLIIFLFYALASSVVTRRLVLTPLDSLTVSVSKANENETDIYGSKRNDEIGELARTVEGGWNRINEAHQRTRLMLDATPLACRLMKKTDEGRFDLFDCNEESVKLFGFKDKKDFIDNYFEIYPEFQPDGSNSVEKGQGYVEEAFVNGSCIVEFDFQTKDGVLIPSEVTLVRVQYEDDYVIAGYTRDLREHQQMMEDIENRDTLLNSINSVATVLLAAANEEKFEESIIEGMEIIGRCMDADCVQIWPNETIDGVLNFTLKYKWLSELGLKAPDVEIGTAVPYSDSWIDIFMKGEHINGPISSLPEEEQALWKSLGITSTITIPLYYDDEFWGLFCVDDCGKERYFSDGEVNILTSAGMMFVNAINRIAQSAEIQEMHARTQILLDTTPLAVSLWNTDLKLFDCNEESVRLFKAKDKQDFITRFFELSPEYQPNGRKSEELALENTMIAFEKGECEFDWMHQTSDGELIPSSAKLMRVAYEDSYAVAAYVRDMREYNRMMQDIHDSSVKLEAALKDTQKANNAKSDFLASMSHEMRTPLNAIIGLSGLSLENTDLDKDAYSNLEKINSSGEMLLSIVNDILDISKIEAGRMELVEVDYDVPSLINDTITQNVLRIGEKPIEFNLDIGEDMYSRLHGDELRIKQIMNNLLSNAIKYTNEGYVELSLHCEQRYKDKVWITIKITDTGKGIRPDDMDKLFMDYSKLDLESNRKLEGTGLGLPITKSLAEMMGGTIEVESEYGKGSVFTVRIAQKFVSDVHLGPEIVKSLTNFRYSDEKRGRNARFSRISIPYAKVLVVDDNVTNLEVAKGLMKPYGMQIDCVTGGQEAIDIIKSGKTRYDAVFMDHMMPDIDGLEATRIIRNEIGTDYAKNIPIIALTANAIAGNEAMFLSNGFQAFVSKPIDVTKLDKIIRQWVRDKNKEKEMGDPEAEAPEEVTAAESPDSDTEKIHIDGMDIAKGISRFNGDKETYFNILSSFSKTTLPLLDTIENVSAEDLPVYAITVHGIKGSSRGVSAYEAGDAAEALEHAAKAGDLDFVSANNPPFLVSVRKLLSDIDEVIAKLYPEDQKPVKERPDTDVLKNLLEACTHFDTDEIDRLTAELDYYEYVSEGDLARELIDSANKYDYSKIKTRLLALFSKEA